MNLVYFSTTLYYASNVFLSNTTLTTPSVTATTTYAPSTLYMVYSTIVLSNALYGSTFALSNEPTITFSTLTYPFYIYLKNVTTSNLIIRLSNTVSATTVIPSGPALSNLYPSTNPTGNAPQVILYGSNAVTWNLY